MQEAYNICYHEIITSIKADCQEIFRVVASYGAKHFEEGLSQKIRPYEDKIDVEVARQIFAKTIQEMYFEGNETVKMTLLNRMNQYLYDARIRQCCANNSWDKECAGEVVSITARQAAAVMVRALHFEKYGEKAAAYRTITKEDCRAFVSSCNVIMGEIQAAVAEDPFHVDRNELIDNKASCIRDVFEMIQTDAGWYFPCDSESYYADSLCNAYWKWIAEDCKRGVSTDINAAFSILLDHFRLT